MRWPAARSPSSAAVPMAASATLAIGASISGVDASAWSIRRFPARLLVGIELGSSARGRAGTRRWVGRCLRLCPVRSTCRRAPVRKELEHSQLCRKCRGKTGHFTVP